MPPSSTRRCGRSREMAGYRGEIVRDCGRSRGDRARLRGRREKHRMYTDSLHNICCNLAPAARTTSRRSKEAARASDGRQRAPAGSTAPVVWCARSRSGAISRDLARSRRDLGVISARSRRDLGAVALSSVWLRPGASMHSASPRRIPSASADNSPRVRTGWAAGTWPTCHSPAEVHAEVHAELLAHGAARSVREGTIVAHRGRRRRRRRRQ